LIYKYFDKEPKYHDAEFYKDRPVSDHIHQEGHRDRLLRTLHDVLFLVDLFPELKTVVDFGCGNGGFLRELSNIGRVMCHGYDLSPAAIDGAIGQYGVNAELKDFVNDLDTCETADIAVMTEVLEHLVDPKEFLRKLKPRIKWIVCSVPANEDAENHYIYHLWAWDAQSFKRMFTDLGYTVLMHYNLGNITSQFLVAKA
jgi:2-polyprenyl-3-methyl-5-hydroxy-6-metoxy-1,4-benzoquinol methylase